MTLNWRSLLQKKGIIYFFEQGQVINFFSNLSKICIISFKDLTFLKRDFPPISKKYLHKVVEEDLEEFFPKEKYSYYLQILSEHGERREVAIWIYDREIEHRAKGLKVKYLIPEPLLYTSKEPTLYLVNREEYYLLIYSQDYKVYNYLTLTQMNSENLLLFLKGLKGLKPKVGIAITNKELNIPELTKEYEFSWTLKGFSESFPFLDFLSKENLKKFQVKDTPISILQKIDQVVFLRSLLYLSLAISVSFYLSARSYENELQILKEKIKEIKGIDGDMGKKSIKDELDLIINKGNDPLFLLKRLAELLPEGSTLGRVYISEDTLELSLMVRDPLVVFNNLSWERCFQEIKLSSPVQSETGLYNLDLKISTSKCRFQEIK